MIHLFIACFFNSPNHQDARRKKSDGKINQGNILKLLEPNQKANEIN